MKDKYIYNYLYLYNRCSRNMWQNSASFYDRNLNKVGMDTMYLNILAM